LQYQTVETDETDLRRAKHVCKLHPCIKQKGDTTKLSALAIGIFGLSYVLFGQILRVFSRRISQSSTDYTQLT
jgi:hypothetical protein